VLLWCCDSLLRHEKQILNDISDPLGVTSSVHSSQDWDFSFSYEWFWKLESDATAATGERSRSFRRFGSATFAPFQVSLPFSFPIRGDVATDINIGSTGDFMVRTSKAVWTGSLSNYVYRQKDLYTVYALNGATCEFVTEREVHGLRNTILTIFASDRATVEAQNDDCQEAGWVGNEYGSCITFAVPAATLLFAQVEGYERNTGDYLLTVNCDHSIVVAPWDDSALSAHHPADVAPDEDDQSSDSSATAERSCWMALPTIVADSHTIDRMTNNQAGSSQGEDYLSLRFGSRWTSFIRGPCDPDTLGCAAPSADDQLPSDPCKMITQGSPMLVFPSEGSEYRNNLACEITLHCDRGRPRVKLTMLNTEQDYDFVALTEGPLASGADPRVLELSGSLEDPGVFASRSSDLVLSFRSDGNTNGAGFTAEVQCSDPGNIVSDGGGDMYDLGNLLMTNLMGDTTTNPHDCSLGELLYYADFEPVPTNCFGADGHYQMLQLDSMWLFLTTNVHDSPIDFMVAGNLGSEGQATVSGLTFNSIPLTGFVKSVCNDPGGDASVNHMIIVDSTLGMPSHSCDFAQGGECTGANSDLDDDIVSGIAPGSPILYILYSTEGGSCLSELVHRQIFDLANTCIDLEQAAPSVDEETFGVDVDDAGHIVFTGSAPIAGWTKGFPRIVPGPIGVDNAVQLDTHGWIQVGDKGIDVDGDWTFDCFFLMEDSITAATATGMTLVGSADGTAIVGTEQAFLGTQATDGGGWQSSNVSLAMLSTGWHRLTVSSTREISSCADRNTGEIWDRVVDLAREAYLSPHLRNCGEVNGYCSVAGRFGESVRAACPETCRTSCTRSASEGNSGAHRVLVTQRYFVDGELVDISHYSTDKMCNNQLCPITIFALGGNLDGTRSFAMAWYRLRILDYAVLDTTGLTSDNDGRLLPSDTINSETVMISRGVDGIDIQWDRFGWTAGSHDTVRVTLDSLGGMELSYAAQSQLPWARCVEAAERATGFQRYNNWTSLVPSEAQTLRVDYVDSDRRSFTCCCCCYRCILCAVSLPLFVCVCACVVLAISLLRPMEWREVRLIRLACWSRAM